MRISPVGPALLALAALVPPGRAGVPQAARPNVLFIAVDDLNTRLGCYGAPVRTPHIDELAARGVRFERAFCQFPLCNPSRTSLLTGRYPTQTGVLDNLKHFRDAFPDLLTLPQQFRAHGYVTARTGKIFHGGIDDEASWVEGGEKGAQRAPRTPQQAQAYRTQSDRWVAAEGPEEEQPDARTATRAIALLEKHRAAPFFLAVGFVKPHSPLIAPKRYFDLYDPARIALPPNFAPRVTLPEGVPAGVLGGNGDLFIQREATEEEARHMIRAYQACMSFVDAQVGRVIEALELLRLREKTVIVFFGDHGYHLGEKGKWSKHNSLYDTGTRVPLIVCAPGASVSGGRCARTVELIDLYPTLAEVCRLPRPAGVEGHSLAPLLKEPAAARAHPAYSVARSRPGLGLSVRTERHRYTQWEGGANGAELYDLESDPLEMSNLAADPAQADTLAAMKALLDRLPRR
jgi:arylsulfatase A-like enzyme